jgi:hypothetical protein
MALKNCLYKNAVMAVFYAVYSNTTVFYLTTNSSVLAKPVYYTKKCIKILAVKLFYLHTAKGFLVRFLSKLLIRRYFLIANAGC